MPKIQPGFEDEVLKARERATRDLTYLQECRCDQLENKVPFELLITALRELKEANEESDKQKDANESSEASGGVESKEQRNILLHQSGAHWRVLQQSLDLANELVAEEKKAFSNPTKYNKYKEASEFIKREINFLTDTVNFSTTAIQNPAFLSEDLAKENGEFKQIQDKVSAHIKTYDESSRKAMLWGLLLATFSALASITMLFVGIAGILPTAGASLGMALAGVGVGFFGMRVGLAIPLHARHTVIADQMKYKLHESIHALHHKPKPDIQRLHGDQTQSLLTQSHVKTT